MFSVLAMRVFGLWLPPRARQTASQSTFFSKRNSVLAPVAMCLVHCVDAGLHHGAWPLSLQLARAPHPLQHVIETVRAFFGLAFAEQSDVAHALESTSRINTHHNPRSKFQTPIMFHGAF